MKLPIPLTVLFFLTALSLLTSCDKPTATQGAATSEKEVVVAATATEEQKACCAEHPAPKAAEASAESIYQITSTWKDAKGKETTLDALGGKIQVITMGYTTCKFACPRLLADLQIIEKGLSEENRAKTHFAFFSIDPEIDTPARLSEYRKENNIPTDRWKLLTSDQSSVQELSVVLGLKYRKVDKSDFAHSNLIIALNEKGEIIHRQEGLSADPAETIAAIIKVNSQ
ncbi:MAG: SCO family protein [Verrucomicrobiales bacterium]|nr:SCO family protein [Verrucomicrobiales bacterium]